MSFHFNLRVYGIHIKNGKVLVTDEIRFGRKMTKFPGGGMEHGESTIETLIRECQEEMKLTPIHIKHFYTTDFFQETQMVQPPQQLISIYYTMDFDNLKSLTIMGSPFDFEEKEGAQGFRFIEMEDISPEMFTFPIDKKVASLIYANNI